MRLHPVRGLSALAVVALPALAAGQELTVVQKLTQDKNPPVTMTSYIGTDKVRWASSDGNEMLAEAGTFTIIDHKKKEYSVITQKDLDALAAQAEARMKNMPAGMREKLAGMMGGEAASIDVHKGEGGRTIAGYACQNWIVTMGNFSRSEQCVTKDLALPPQAWESFQAFSNRMRSMAGPASKIVDSLQEKMKQMSGLALSSTTTVSVLGKSSTSISEVTEIKKGPIPPSAWQLPAGYKQTESPFARMGQRK